jgi:hypothetical protein
MRYAAAGEQAVGSHVCVVPDVAISCFRHVRHTIQVARSICCLAAVGYIMLEWSCL